MIASFLLLLAALGLLAAASRRPAERLGLAPTRRRQAKGLAAALLGLSFVAGVAAGGSLLDLVQWVLAIGMIVPPVALGLTLYGRR